MKKTTYLLLALLFVVSFFITSPAKAQVPPCTDADPTTGGCPTNSGSTGMPINNGVIYLLLAGSIIGIATIKRKEAVIVKV